MSLVIFDMDGTLTLPMLDFDLIREETGIRGTLLEGLEKMSHEDRARAEAIIERHEAVAADHSTLQPGAAETVAALRRRGWQVALMTRNSRPSVEAFERRHHLGFDFVRTREDGPVKPSPEPVLDICKALAVRPNTAWVIGDFHFDILSGKSAGCATVLFLEPGLSLPAWAGDADHVISKLPDLLALIDSNIAQARS